MAGVKRLFNGVSPWLLLGIAFVFMLVAENGDYQLQTRLLLLSGSLFYSLWGMVRFYRRMKANELR